MSRKRLRVIEERCVGCRICELSCSMFHHNGAFNPKNGLIQVESNWSFGLNKPVLQMDRLHICQQCEPAPCAEACPVNAFVNKDDLSIWVIDQEECVWCQQCFDECPYNMIVMNKEKEVAMKCDLCKGEPLCVRYCPTGALVFEE